ncbi:MAG: nicotinate (nicotinamide) nucleotide adenylyltransferase [Candidatus Dormibacteria bacterium]
MTQRLGVFGGTFDPVHLGHLSVARQCAEQLGLGSVLLVPSNLPPHRAAPGAPAADRLALVEIAVAGDPVLQACDLEVARGGTSFMVDTLTELCARYPGAELWLLLGADAARDLPQWKEPEAVTAMARLALFNRGGSVWDGPSGHVRVVVESPPISATEVRRLLAEGKSADALLPGAVSAEIRRRGLYGPGAGCHNPPQ